MGTPGPSSLLVGVEGHDQPRGRNEGRHACGHQDTTPLCTSVLRYQPNQEIAPISASGRTKNSIVTCLPWITIQPRKRMSYNQSLSLMTPNSVEGQSKTRVNARTVIPAPLSLSSRGPSAAAITCFLSPRHPAGSLFLPGWLLSSF